jgi:phosphoribosylformylglycinamidine synthase
MSNERPLSDHGSTPPLLVGSVGEAQAETHGLTGDEFRRIGELLGRGPTLTELGIVAAMWSEHCSYKSSRNLLKGLPTTSPRVLQGPGENAGALSIGDNLAVVFKIESHNHPSFIEPFQGAATGVGGILRDIFTMGARPIANLNSLRFGSPEHDKTARLLRGVVAGISFYGNCVGVPTVGGEVAFDPCYDGNILVNAMTVGIAPADRLFRGAAAGIGNPVLYLGARTGRDGIHGATMASAEFDGGPDGVVEDKRPTVQVGDPFTEKLLIEACLALMQTDLLVGIQDMGAAGLTSSSIEMAARAHSGLELDLDAVPRREPGMTPYEVMLSESQERMLLVAKAGCEEQVMAIARRWELECTVVGRVTDTQRLRLWSGGELYADLPIEPLAEGVRYDRPRQRPAYLDVVAAESPEQLLNESRRGQVPRPDEELLAMLASPNIASKAWVYRQYDHMVQNRTVLLPGGSDAAIVRVEVPGRTLQGLPDPHHDRAKPVAGLAITTDGNSRYCYLDPYLGAQLAIAEATRNVSCTGAEPIGVTDCLNFGNPERPEIMWQLAEAIRGLSDGCRALEVPIISGNVSLYNETDGNAIYPTPILGVVGLLNDVSLALSAGFQEAGDEIALLGEPWTGSLGGSELLALRTGKVVGTLAPLDLPREAAVQRVLRQGAAQRLLRSAHDCAEGGLAVAIAESCLLATAPLGAALDLRVPEGRSMDAALFGESPSRIVVSYRPEHRAAVQSLAVAAAVPLTVMGTTGGRALRWHHGDGAPLELPIDRMHGAYATAFDRW